MLTPAEDSKHQKYLCNILALPPECDCLCLFRPCYRKDRKYGSFTQGRGYTDYYKTFEPCCTTRMITGCPSFRNQLDDKIDWTTLFNLCSALTKGKKVEILFHLKLIADLKKHPKFIHE